jgi:hypothetical protein
MLEREPAGCPLFGSVTIVTALMRHCFAADSREKTMESDSFSTGKFLSVGRVVFTHIASLKYDSSIILKKGKKREKLKEKEIDFLRTGREKGRPS